MTMASCANGVRTETGLLLCEIEAELYVQPLNNTVVFLKKTDIILTSDEWRIVINIDLSTYQEVASIVKTDLRLKDRRKN